MRLQMKKYIQPSAIYKKCLVSKINKFIFFHEMILKYQSRQKRLSKVKNDIEHLDMWDVKLKFLMFRIIKEQYFTVLNLVK